MRNARGVRTFLKIPSTSAWARLRYVGAFLLVLQAGCGGGGEDTPDCELSAAGCPVPCEGAACCDGDACEPLPAPERPVCVLEPIDDTKVRVVCEDGVEAELWTTTEKSGYDCAVEEGGNTGTPTIRCGEYVVELNGECPDGFPGNVYFGQPPEHERASAALAFALSGCTDIHGDLVLDGFDGLTIAKLEGPFEPVRVAVRPGHVTTPVLPSALARLASVGGSVRVRHMSAFETLRFPALTRIGGELRVEDNYAMRVLTFGALEEVGGALWADRNGALHTIAFDALQTIAKQMRFAENPNLADVRAPSLRSVGAAIRIRANAKLPLLAFPALETGQDYLRIDSNPSLTEVLLPALQDLDGGLHVDQNGALARVDARALAHLGGSLTVEENRALVEVLVPALAEVGGVSLRNNAALETLMLPALRTVQNAFVASQNRALKAVSLAMLESVGSMRVNDCPELLGMNVENLTSIRGDLRVENNGKYRQFMTSIQTPLVIDGHALFQNNDALEIIHTPMWNHVGGTITFDSNPSLRSLDLSKLTYLGGGFVLRQCGSERLTLGDSDLKTVPFVTVQNNPSLVFVSMLGMETIDSDLTVSDNPQLTYITADALDVVAHLFIITNNPNFPQSRAFAILAQLSENYAANIVGNKP